MPESSSSSIFEQVSVLVTDSHLFCLEDVSPIIQASSHIAVYKYWMFGKDSCDEVSIVVTSTCIVTKRTLNMVDTACLAGEEYRAGNEWENGQCSRHWLSMPLMLIYTLAWVLFIGKIVISRTPKQCAPRHLPMEGIVSEWHSHLQVWNIRSISGGLSISYIVPEETQQYLWSPVISHRFSDRLLL